MKNSFFTIKIEEKENIHLEGFIVENGQDMATLNTIQNTYKIPSTENNVQLKPVKGYLICL